jgi:hypothetical protein
VPSEDALEVRCRSSLTVASSVAAVVPSGRSLPVVSMSFRLVVSSG